MNCKKHTVENIYETFGQFDMVATFYFKRGTEASDKYGDHITGVIEYTFKERKNLENTISKCEYKGTEGIIKVRYLNYDRDEEFAKNLIKNGFSTNDIEEIDYLPWERNNKFIDDNKEKKVPNILEISIDDIPNIENSNPDDIWMRLFENRLQDNEDLLYTEQCEYVGMLLAYTDGKIPPNIKDCCGIGLDEIQNNSIVYRQYLKSKERKSGLTKEERVKLIDLELSNSLKNIKVFDNELVKAFGKSFDVRENQKLYDFLRTEVLKFRTERLLQIKYNVYWDIESFCHVYLRHVKETKVEGNSSTKSIIPYKYKEIKRLIDQVLKSIQDEIIDHFSKGERKRFFRSGERSVYFNGHYYCIYISKKGRLESFYPRDRHYKNDR